MQLMPAVWQLAVASFVMCILQQSIHMALEAHTCSLFLCPQRHILGCDDATAVKQVNALGMPLSRDNMQCSLAVASIGAALSQTSGARAPSHQGRQLCPSPPDPDERSLAHYQLPLESPHERKPGGNACQLGRRGAPRFSDSTQRLRCNANVARDAHTLTAFMCCA